MTILIFNHVYASNMYISLVKLETLREANYAWLILRFSWSTKENKEEDKKAEIYLPFWIIIRRATLMRNAFFNTLMRMGENFWVNSSNAILLPVHLTSLTINGYHKFKTKFTTLQFIWFQKFFFHYDWFDARLTKMSRTRLFWKLLPLAKFSDATKRITRY